jgi:SAM-dependent methyltransferase
LQEHSIDLITAGQAFHWFKRGKAREEFLRILKPGGYVVLAWNDRQTDTSPFLAAYEDLLFRFGTDYAQVNHRHIDETVIASFFGPASFKVKKFDNDQTFDFEGLRGRLLSSSYTPEPGDPRYEPMLQTLEQIFQAHNENGVVRFEYETIVYYGQLAG